MSAASASPKSAYFWRAPKANRFATNCDAPLYEEVFNIAIVEVESVVEPDGVCDMSVGNRCYLYIHASILAISASLLASCHRDSHRLSGAPMSHHAR